LVCLRFRTYRTYLPCSAGLLGLSLCLSACGGGGLTVTKSGAEAVLNGATLATATSHWVASTCRVQAELTADNGFLSVVTSPSGTTTQASETWAVGSNPDSVTVGPGIGLEGAYWITALGSISGSTTQESFTANVTVETSSTPQSLGSCTFTLTQKGLTAPADAP